MESNETLYRVFLPTSKKMIITERPRLPDMLTREASGVAYLLDGISRQKDIDPDQHMDGIDEDLLTQACAAYFSSCSIQHNISHALFAKQNLRDHRLPRNFQEST